jgi:hypothetical protein
MSAISFTDEKLGAMDKSCFLNRDLTKWSQTLVQRPLQLRLNRAVDQKRALGSKSLALDCDNNIILNQMNGYRCRFLCSL